MKKYWVPASVLGVVIGAFFVFQNAGVVSPKLGYWEMVADLSNIPTSQYGGSLVNKFEVNVGACEYRLRFKKKNDNAMSSAIPIYTFASAYPDQVQRDSRGAFAMSFSSNRAGVNPYNMGMPTQFSYNLNFSPYGDPTKYLFNVHFYNSAATGVGFSQMLAPGVSIVRLEKRCYEFAPQGPADLNEAAAIK